MNITYDFTGEVAVVTGAARGVGRALVSTLAEAGGRVVAADRDEPGLAETCAPYPESVLPVPADVSDPGDAARIIGSAVSHFGRLSICVNNAAVAPHTSLLDETVQVWDTVYAVNCRGTFLMTQRAGQAMIDQGGGGRIINFSSGVS
ncbi:MAG TPA: SDR family oxidoreductase, partial [Streptosporangiaceae bacterium]